MALLLGRCYPRIPFFISLNGWKTEGGKSRLYGRYGKTVQPRLAVFSMVFKLIWSLALYCHLQYHFGSIDPDKLNIRCSFCSCVSIRGTDLVQTLWYSNLSTIVSNAFQLIFSSVCSSLIVICWFTLMSWLRCSFFLVWQLCTAFGTWLFFHITVATAETHHPPPPCAHIPFLFPIKVQQVSVNIYGWNFFHMEEFSDTPLFHMHFHVRWQQNVMEYW